MNTGARVTAKIRQPAWSKRALGVLLAVAAVWAWHIHFWPNFHAACESQTLYFIQALVEDGMWLVEDGMCIGERGVRSVEDGRCIGERGVRSVEARRCAVAARTDPKYC